MAGFWVLTAAASMLLAPVQGVPGSDYLLAFVGSTLNVTEWPSVTLTWSGDTVTAELTSPFYNGSQSVLGSVDVSGTTKALDSTFLMTSMGKSSRALRLQSKGGEVSTVYGTSGQQAGSDAFLALPTSSLGMQYVVLTAQPQARSTSFLVILAANDVTNNSINITDNNTNNSTNNSTTDSTNNSTTNSTNDATNSTDTTRSTAVKVTALWGGKSITFSNITFQGLRPVNFTLETYEAFLVTSPDDLSATHVTSDRPVAVFSGNVDDQGRIMVEQMLPVTTWGTDHVTIPTPDKVGMPNDTYRVVCSADKTTLTLNDDQNFFMEYAGRMQTLSLNASQPHFISANKPIQVVKVLEEDKQAGRGPCLSLLVPVQQWRKSYIFTSTQTALLSVAVESLHNSSLLLNQSHLLLGTWLPVPNSSLVAGHQFLEPGTYILNSTMPDIRFGAHLTVFASNRSSCHPVDMEMQLINPNYTTFIMSGMPTCSQTPVVNATVTPTTKSLPTPEELDQVVAETVTNLTVDKQTLGAVVRRKTSIPDPRPSSTSIGAVGIILIVIVPVVIVALDVPKLARDFKYARNSVRKFRQRRRRPGPEVIVVKEFPY